MYAPGKNCKKGWTHGQVYWFVDDGWTSLYDALESAGTTVTLSFIAELPDTNPGLPNPNAHDSTFATGGTWKPISTLPSAEPDDRLGSFTFNATTGYVVAHADLSLTWYVDQSVTPQDLVTTTPGSQLEITTASGAIPNGSYHTVNDG